jgi:hypothetical protein
MSVVHPVQLVIFRPQVPTPKSSGSHDYRDGDTCCSRIRPAEGSLTGDYTAVRVTHILQPRVSPRGFGDGFVALSIAQDDDAKDQDRPAQEHVYEAGGSPAMIVVRVELHSARTGQKTELARMEICNDDSGSAERRDYTARTLRGRSTAQLDRRVVQRQGTLKNWPSEALHVWNLVAVLLGRMGYGVRA